MFCVIFAGDPSCFDILAYHTEIWLGSETFRAEVRALAMNIGRKDTGDTIFHSSRKTDGLVLEDPVVGGCGKVQYLLFTFEVVYLIYRIFNHFVVVIERE